MRARHGTTLVLVTHDASIAGRADREVHLFGGRVVKDTGGQARADDIAGAGA